MTTRRSFLSVLGSGLAAPFLRRSPLSPENETSARGRPLAVPSAEQLAWQDLEIGMFIHFAPNTWQDREYDDRSTPLSAINPQIDTDQWVECAEALGAKYIVFVAKHVGGFCMWQTETTAYSIRNTPWRAGKGDVLAELSASCRRRGFQLGVYLSPRDDDFGAAGGGLCASPQRQAAYNDRYRQQLRELLTRYGPITEIWFDGSIVVPVGDLLARHAPRAMVFQGPHATIRWVGNEDGFAPYPAWNAISRSDARTGVATSLHGDPQGDVWMPNEVDVSLRRPNWFWSTTNHANLLSLDALLEIYYRSVGRGAQLLLNVTPDRRGLIPEADVVRLREFGQEIRRRFGRSAAEASGSGNTLLIRFNTPTRIDHVILQEDISRGERVRKYRLEGRVGDRWISLGAGSAIGHKRIQPIEPNEVSALRFGVVSSAGQPLMRRFAAFDTGAAPPPTWDAPAKSWADNEAGRWQGNSFEADLSKAADAPGKFRLRCVADGEATAEFESVQALIDGAEKAEAVRPEGRRKDVKILTLSLPLRTLVVRGRVRGATSGTLLLRKL
jgi:alpha-L-fucosidase